MVDKILRIYWWWTNKECIYCVYKNKYKKYRHTYCLTINVHRIMISRIGIKENMKLFSNKRKIKWLYNEIITLWLLYDKMLDILFIKLCIM